MFYSVVGDVTPKQVSVPEILTGLTANTINVVNVPALAAEQLQWASRLDHINTRRHGHRHRRAAFHVRARWERSCRQTRRRR